MVESWRRRSMPMVVRDSPYLQPDKEWLEHPATMALKARLSASEQENYRLHMDFRTLAPMVNDLLRIVRHEQGIIRYCFQEGAYSTGAQLGAAMMAVDSMINAVEEWVKNA